MKIQIKKKPQLVIAKNKTMWRTFLKIPVFVWLIAILTTSVFAATIYIMQKSTIITNSPSGTLTTSMPTTLLTTSGSFYNYSFAVTNDANRVLNYTTELTIRDLNGTLIDGEARLQILNSTGGLIQESTTPVAGNLTVQDLNRILSVSSSFSGEIRLELNQSADNTTYLMNLNLLPGTFNWRW